MSKPDTPNDDTSTRQTTEKNRVSISLSKMITIDVDHRKRSSKTEIVDLYYDRIHNPENCYRFAVTWPPSTTSCLVRLCLSPPKFVVNDANEEVQVDHALSSWASQAEKYGLKLVEVPIAEASKVSENEPFRA